MLKGLYSTKLFKVIVVIIFFTVLVFLNPNNFFDGVRGVIFRVTYPFQKSFYLTSSKMGDIKDLIFSIGDLKEENENLIQENHKLNSEIAKLKDIKRENDLLRKEIQLLPKDKFKLQAARVIGQSSDVSGGWILINKGKKDGLQNGMPVVVSGSNLIGKIDEVLSSTAKVSLLTNPNSVVNAVVSGSEAKGVVRGEYGLGLILDMVMQTDVINKRDEVLTSGLGEKTPRGLFIGRIQEVHPSKDHLFQQAIVNNPIHFSKLQYVFVIKE